MEGGTGVALDVYGLHARLRRAESGLSLARFGETFIESGAVIRKKRAIYSPLCGFQQIFAACSLSS